MAAMRRFRPIFLTAVTTFLGLGPMIFETSIQALFLVPMAISLGVGTLVSSIVILILMPVAFSIMEQTLNRRQIDVFEGEIGEEAMSGQPAVGLSQSRQTTTD